MIRVRFLANAYKPEGYPDPIVEPLIRLMPHLPAHGIEFVDDRPDVILVQPSLVEQAGPSAPLILFDECDGGMLWWGLQPDRGTAQQWLASPRVLGIAKIARYANLELYNQPWVDDAYHMQLISDASGLELPRPEKGSSLSEAAYEKMVPLFGFWAVNSCHPFVAREFAAWEDRKIDVICTSTMHYARAAVTHHRHLALEKLEKLRLWRTLIGRGRVLSSELYVEAMRQSRICVCPWGYGETTIRDYEAMYAGCVVIKPRTHFIDCYPEIDERHYVPCAVDFSDLQENIDHVLTHWHDYEEMRVNNRTRLLECWKAEALAGRLAKVIRRFMGANE